MKHSLILTDGGMGDLVCELVAVNYIIRTNPRIQFQIWVPDYLRSFAIHVLPPKSIVYPFSARKDFDGTIPCRTTQWQQMGHTPMRAHPVDYGFHMLADKHIYDLNEKNYLQIRPKQINIKEFSLPKNYVCIATTAAEPCKAMSTELIQGITDYISKKDCTPIYLGKTESLTGFNDLKISAVTPILPDTGINLIDKTNLLQAARIIHGAKAFIGMDGGLVHLAGCTDVPIIAGYSLVDPIHVAPIRNGSQMWKFIAIEPDKDIANRYFQTNNLFYSGDYRTFPGWQKVLENLTLEKFIHQLSYIV
jgi:ADP-heptose:LPS heptosyltransferase